jgi:polar amino acid transport system ATP-binding protein
VMCREVGELIRQLNSEGVTMLCVTHDIDLAQAISEKAVFLNQGVVSAEATFAALANHDHEATRTFFNRTKA